MSAFYSCCFGRRICTSTAAFRGPLHVPMALFVALASPVCFGGPRELSVARARQKIIRANELDLRRTVTSLDLRSGGARLFPCTTISPWAAGPQRRLRKQVPPLRRPLPCADRRPGMPTVSCLLRQLQISGVVNRQPVSAGQSENRILVRRTVLSESKQRQVQQKKEDIPQLERRGGLHRRILRMR